MVGLAFNPVLGTSFYKGPVDTALNKTINITYTDDTALTPPDDTKIIEVTVSVDSPYILYSKTMQDKTATVNITGTVPIDVFDQYRITYVDKDKSDKTQTPVVSALVDVPDHKDVYKVTPDPRSQKLFTVSITVKTKSETSGITNTYDNSYEVIITQTYDKIKNWIDTYYKTRF